MVSPWKVILATLVIFVAGLVTGAVGVQRLLKPNRPALRAEPMHPWMLRDNFRAELDRRLQLTPEQSERIERITREGQERVREISSLVTPEIQAELKAVREEIRDTLTPEQRAKFEEILRARRPRPLDIERPPGQRPGRTPREGFSLPENSGR
jgi:Spy/CpxP family protein refolding chaperone